LTFSASLGGAVYFWALRPIDGPVTPHPAVAYPAPTSSPPPVPAAPAPTSVAPPPVEPAPTPVQPEETTIGLAPAGTIEPSRVPVVETGESEVRGSLDRDVIRRVIRRHINEVRLCYEQGLRTEPTLSGRITVSFIVSPTGAVQVASLADSTFVASSTSQSVVACILTAVRRWQFPTPEGGGIVSINYPFVLTSD
jgi:outer membrane biosynthesis protein TonB